MARKLKTMDGNNAAAHVAYAFTDVAAIYPITPSSVMAEHVDEWAAAGRKNLFGQTVKVAEMQSEGGAAGAVHGSLSTGALTTTFTASQGLLLMIPNMYKIAAENVPCVMHVSARALATHALSIFGDHSDVMACRGTGFSMLASTNPQEVMDLAAVAHLAAIDGQAAFLHFFDGFRTSHEIQKIGVWDYSELDDMLDREKVQQFRDGALNPNHPHIKGTAENPDIFFQTREACNTHYEAIPGLVVKYMDKVNEKLGTDYKPFNYYGAEDAEYVIIAMGSVVDALKEVCDYLNGKGCKVGVVNVHLYRPFVADYLDKAIPQTCKRIAVLDRCKEPGALGEPLYLDVIAALAAKRPGMFIIGGRYGLGSKDVGTGCLISAYNNLMAEEPKAPFTLGIEDDVTHLSLPVTDNTDCQAKGNTACKFWGLGGDGTVGANKSSIKIIGDNTDLKAQAYFQYDSKKSGGVTISHLRFGPEEIRSTYYVTASDFVACHNVSYLEKYPMAQDCKPGGTFLMNCGYTVEELADILPADEKRYIAKNHVNCYTIDAVKIGKELGLGNKYNMVLMSAFFKLANIIPIDDAVKYMKQTCETSYGKLGEEVVNKNKNAVDAGLTGLIKLEIPEEWAETTTGGVAPMPEATGNEALDTFAKDILVPANAMVGDSIPVSRLMTLADGSIPSGTAALEKRGIAVDVPSWIPENCIQCNQCAFVCPHAAIRPFVLNEAEAAAAPEGAKLTKLNGNKSGETLYFTMSLSPMDCTGCGSCINVCPSKKKALGVASLADAMPQQKVFDYAVKEVSDKELSFKTDTVKGSQFRKPLFEFSGACAGCGETPYVKLITQLFGDRMLIANATGCSSIWGASAPSIPYTTNKAGKGPAWANSLFEDNAEFGYGMMLGTQQRRAKLQTLVSDLVAAEIPADLKEAAEAWLAAFNEGEGSREPSAAFEAKINEYKDTVPAIGEIAAMTDMLVKPSQWIFGGDGWAYDIGYGGVDHVLAQNQNVNIFVLDTEVYSNTGGQASKATPIGAVAEFAAAGKAVKKKDLAQIAMTYGYVYVAQIGMGADMNQTIKAIKEAEAYDGPSLVIAYAPCINHHAKAGMAKSQETIKRAVKAGYWHLFRFNPALEQPFTLDSKEPTDKYNDYIMSESRYSSLTKAFPERAKELFTAAEEYAAEKYEMLVKQQANQ